MGQAPPLRQVRAQGGAGFEGVAGLGMGQAPPLRQVRAQGGAGLDGVARSPHPACRRRPPGRMYTPKRLDLADISTDVGYSEAAEGHG